MIFKITIYYKNENDCKKIIKIPLNSQIQVLKSEDIYFITLGEGIDRYFYSLKEEEINGFEVEKIN